MALSAHGGAVLAASSDIELRTGRIERPAEFVRSRQNVTLLSNLDLQVGDQVVTRSGGRAQVNFGNEDSIVLAEKGRLLLHSVDVREDGTPLLRAKLEDGIAQVQLGSETPRDLRLNAGRLRLRAEKADFIVSTAAEGQLCVLSGEVASYAPESNREVRVSDGCVRLDDAGQLVAIEDPALEARVVAATAFAPIDLSVPPTGWTVVVASLTDPQSAQAEARGLLGEGLPARAVEGKDMWRVAIGGFEDVEQARRYADQLRNTHGLFEAWVSRY